MDDSVNDLLRDYRLQTRFDKSHTIHFFDDPDAPPSSPQRQEHWKKSRTLGHGGQGRVVLQTCTGGSRGYTQRAVKMIPLQEDGRQRYLRELETIIKFSHDKYAKYFAKTVGWYTSQRTLYIAMEYFPSGDLQTYALKHAPLPENECREITSQILRGLATMHQENFAHRDVKPQNVLIQQSPHSVPPASWWVKLADFGISKRLESGTSGSTRRIGTLLYMAPELLRSGLSNGRGFDYPPVDMWALGVTAFFVLTKTLPFQDVSSAIDYGSDVSRPFPGAAMDDCRASQGAQAFIRALMRPRPTERLNSRAAMGHVWIHSCLPELEIISTHSESSASSSRSSSFDDGTSGALGFTTVSSQLYSKSWSHDESLSTDPTSEGRPPRRNYTELTSRRGASQDEDRDAINQTLKNLACITTQCNDNEAPDLSSALLAEEARTYIMAQFEDNEPVELSTTRLTEEVGAHLTTRYEGNETLGVSTVLPTDELACAEGNNDEDDLHTVLLRASFLGDVTTVRQLLENGVDLQISDPYGSTALSIASDVGHEDVVKLLVEKGANLESRDGIGDTPLLRAAFKGHQSVVRLLAKAGADLEAKNHIGNTPLATASWKGDEAMARLLMEQGSSIETKDSSGSTPLLLAASNGHTAIAKHLLEKGANIGVKNKFGDRALSLAIRNGHEDVVRLLEHLVLEKGRRYRFFRIFKG
ncbi:hypothetical protein CDV31_005057 [Fusarium ambrosium]|uniref:Protein kinase domain-containing protein n=1 Tax=Fusarium ambrosium TaxID=131363 RepID=A0A428ULL9_9HYPO|nr:hypothetical protein CDV31_005057 [Fusarium ambrosium]